MADRPKLHKAIAHSGLMSRRAAENLIAQGRVTVAGRTAGVGDRVDPLSDVVEVDGKRIPVQPDLVTYLLNKPTGVVSTVDDPQGRPTVVEMVPGSPRVYPVGRLDADSEGLLLLTNDGTLADLVMHPRYGIDKTYMVMVRGEPGPWIGRLRTGVELDDGPAAALSARFVDSSGGRCLVEMGMGEGRNREVRRMFAALGLEVMSLARTAVGPIRDAGLRPGQWRRLDAREVASIYGAAR